MQSACPIREKIFIFDCIDLEGVFNVTEKMRSYYYDFSHLNGRYTARFGWYGD